jgi:hypothetical protein
VRFDGVPTKVEPAPLLGEHTTEVLSDISALTVWSAPMCSTSRFNS